MTTGHDQSQVEMQDQFVRTLLGSARSDDPPLDATTQAWARFSNLLLASSAAVGAVPSAAALSTTWLARLVRPSALKYLLIGAVGGGALTFSWLSSDGARRRDSTTAMVGVPGSQPVIIASQPVAPSVSETAPLPERQVAPALVRDPRRAAPAGAVHWHEKSTVVEPRVDVAARAEANAAVQPSSLAAETAALDAARNATATGAFHRALDLLDQYQQNFPNGVLRADAQMATIETLYAQGERSEAARRAARFLAELPNDPHAAALKRLFGE